MVDGFRSALCNGTKPTTNNQISHKGQKRLNPSNETLGLSEEDKSDPGKVIQALVKRFGGSVSVQAERTKMRRVFQSE